MNKGLAAHCLPSDAFAVVGISWTDLYPSAKQNFVLGQAAAEKRSAVVSFGRFETNRGPDAPALKSEDIMEVDSELIWKMFKVNIFVVKIRCIYQLFVFFMTTKL